MFVPLAVSCARIFGAYISIYSSVLTGTLGFDSAYGTLEFKSCEIVGGHLSLHLSVDLDIRCVYSFYPTLVFTPCASPAA